MNRFFGTTSSGRRNMIFSKNLFFLLAGKGKSKDTFEFKKKNFTTNLYLFKVNSNNKLGIKNEITDSFVK